MSLRATCVRAAAALVFATLGVGCSSSNPSPSPTATSGPANQMIAIRGNDGAQSYNPSTVIVHVGQTVAWQNTDVLSHTATADAGSFNTGVIMPGAMSAPVPMNTAGTFTYHCTIHPGMVATITVQ